MMKFFYNGIKVDGKLYRGWFSFCDHRKIITFYSVDYGSLPKEIQQTFDVKNDSDSMTDYFEKDHFVIFQESEFWNDALKSAISARLRIFKRTEKKILNLKSHGKMSEYHESSLINEKKNIEKLSSFYKK